MKLWVSLLLLSLVPSLAKANQPLSKVVLPSLELSDTDLPSVLEYLSIKANELGARPHNFVLYDPSGSLASDAPPVTLSLNNIPFSQAFNYVTQLTGTSYLIDPRVVWVGKSEDLTLLGERRASRIVATLQNRQFDRLKRITVPEVDCSGATLQETLELLRSVDRAKGGTGNFAALPGPVLDPAKVTLNFKARNLSLAELAIYLGDLADFRLDILGTCFVYRSPESPASKRSVLSPLHNRSLAGKRVPEISIVEASLSDVIDLIRHHTDSPGQPGGLNLVNSSKSEQPISFDLRNASLLEILYLANDWTGTGSKSGPGGVVQIYDLE